MEQAKEGLTTLSEKKDEYLAKRDAKKLEESISEFETEGNDSFVTKLKEKSKRMKFKPKLSELELIQEQMKQIEHDFPTVISEENNLPILPPKKAKKWPNLLAASLLSFFAVILLFGVGGGLPVEHVDRQIAPSALEKNVTLRCFHAFFEP